MAPRMRLSVLRRPARPPARTVARSNAWRALGLRWRRRALRAWPQHARPSRMEVHHHWRPQMHMHVNSSLYHAWTDGGTFAAAESSHRPVAAFVCASRGEPLRWGTTRRLSGAAMRFAGRRRDEPIQTGAGALSLPPSGDRSKGRIVEPDTVGQAGHPALFTRASSPDVFRPAAAYSRRRGVADLRAGAYRMRRDAVADVVRSDAPARRAVELAWRIRRPGHAPVHFSATDGALLPRHNAHAATPSARGVAPAAAQDETNRVRDAQPERTAATLRPASGPGAPVTATALDPALAERVADDVVRRIEKRMRIERERRGL